MSSYRAYDPACDNFKTAYRALLKLYRRGKWELLREMGVKRTATLEQRLEYVVDTIDDAVRKYDRDYRLRLERAERKRLPLPRRADYYSVYIAKQVPEFLVPAMVLLLEYKKVTAISRSIQERGAA